MIAINNNLVKQVVLPICIVFMALFTDTQVIDRQLSVKLLILALCMLLCLKNLEIPKSNITLFFAGFLLCSVISLTRAINPVEGIFDMARIIVMFLALCIFSGRDLKKNIVIIGMAMAIYGLFIPSGWIFRMGTMGCRNQWAQAMVLILPFCVYIYKENKWLSITASSLILYNLYMLNNRTSILAIGVACLALAITDKRFRWIALGCVGVLVLLIGSNTESLTNRFEYWLASIELAKSNLLFGVGAGNWQYEIMEWYGRMPSTVGLDNGSVVLLRPHNDYLLVLCETGVMGLLYYVGILVSGLYYAMKQKNKLVFVGITMFCVISLFSFPKERPFLFFMLIMYLSMLKFNSFNYKKLTFASTILMSVLCLYLFQYHTTERHMAKIQILTKNRQWNSVLLEAEKCSAVNPNTLAMVPVAWYKSNAYLHLRNYGKAVLENDIAYEDNPNSVYVLDRMGCFERMFGSENANVYFDRITEMVPNFAVSRSKSNELAKKFDSRIRRSHER